MEGTKKLIRTWYGNGKMEFLEALAKAERLLFKGTGVYYYCDDMRRYIAVSSELTWESKFKEKRDTYAEYHDKAIEYANGLADDERFCIYVDISKTLGEW